MKMLEGKTILITGATGSFGNTILNYLLNTDIGEIRVFSRDEKKQDDLRKKYLDSRINFFVGDVRDFEAINRAMYEVDFVFQAAALKQVPSCEFNPMEAIKTNVLGSENVLEAAIRNEVQRVVVLSTDKAVYPINTMGMTKALMEKLAISKARDFRLKKYGGVFTATRYGNVMASRGSIIPLFMEQALNNESLTITDPNMTRFMMSLDDSVELVLHAFLNGTPGDIFVQKSPACTIETLADAIIQLTGSKSNKTIIGPRHGEKLYETLCSSEELSKAIDEGDFYRIPADLRDMSYSKYLNQKSILLEETYNSHNTYRMNVEETIELLLKLDYVQNKLR